MSELPKNYDPKAIEEKWLQRWLDDKTFHVTPERGGEPYTIVIPPPNVTGILHMGHALNNTIQDVLIRWQRMKGRNALWVPGTDHAGIATQNVVERALKKEEGKRRQDLGREKFVKRVWSWKEQYGNTIIRQLKRLGASCDWERERFTMDAGLSNAVAEVFIRLYNKSLIYRGEYIINWCPRCQTALSDEESEHRDLKGHLYHLRYPVKGAPGRFVVVATTRPETFLGDTAVAVNPKDERYTDLVGKMLVLPVLGREIPVIADEFVDPKFGTGCVKVTPAHDPNDFQMGQRHSLPSVNVMTDDGHMNDHAGPYQGQERFACRKQIMADLEAAGLVEKVEDHHHSVGHCYRCASVVEPRLSKQWFVRMKPLAEPCIKASREGRVEFVPEHWNKTYLHWMENIRDWCISRQLWWGHRVPVFYDLTKVKDAVAADAKRKGRETEAGRALAAGASLHDLLAVALRTIDDDLIREMAVASKEDLAAREPARYVQDADVLDTWASSWLWPFSVFGWPEQTADLKFYYPTNTLVTASEIIFFWVARMIMAGCEFMGEVPFNKIYIHGTVRDDQGRKMSKSLGNSIDPLDIINDYSADALRFSLIMLTATGQDVYVSKEKFELGRNFGTKIWNAARFIQMHKTAEPIDVRAIRLNPEQWSADDWHIVGKVEDAWKACEDCLEKFRFNDYAHVLYEFFWHEYCDWYVEYAKDVLYNADEARRVEVLKVMHYVFDRALRLLQPLMPFLTEELWHGMGYGAEGESIAFAPWPDASQSQLRNLAQPYMDYVDAKHEIIGLGRKLRADFEIAPAQKVDIVIKPHNDAEANALRNDARAISMMLKAQSLTIDQTFVPSQAMPSSLGRLGTIYMGLGANVDAKAEIAKMQKQIEQIDNALRGIAAKLGNPNFLQRAKPEVVEAEKARQAEYMEKRDKLAKIIASLGD